jgi:hypothetical protein
MKTPLTISQWLLNWPPAAAFQWLQTVQLSQRQQHCCYITPAALLREINV